MAGEVHRGKGGNVRKGVAPQVAFILVRCGLAGEVHRGFGGHVRKGVASQVALIQVRHRMVR